MLHTKKCMKERLQNSPRLPKEKKFIMFQIPELPPEEQVVRIQCLMKQPIKLLFIVEIPFFSKEERTIMVPLIQQLSRWMIA